MFGAGGLAMASWVSRLPAIRDEFRLTPSHLGYVLLAMSVGAVAALPLSGLVVHWLRPARACWSAVALISIGLAAAGLADVVPVLMVSIFAVGVGTGICDVAMNVEGAAVEQLLKRDVMPRFHAGFSLGTVAGAAGGAAAAALGVSVRVHLITVAVIVIVVATVGVRRFLPQTDPVYPDPDPTGADLVSAERNDRGLLAAWREPRTIVIGLLCLGMAFCEGSANDWLALGLVDGYRVDHALAAAGFGVFVTAMTAARAGGAWTLERFGRVSAMRGGAVLVLAGVAMVVVGATLRDVVGLVPALLVAAAGSLAWGAGAALGFPVAMSAAADDPARSAARVSVVSTIGYTAFIAGPPLLGLLADRVGVVRALLGISVAVLLSVLSAGATRPVNA